MGRTKLEYDLDLQQQTETFEDCKKQVNTVLCRSKMLLKTFVKDFGELNLEVVLSRVDYKFPFAFAAVVDVEVDELVVFDSEDLMKAQTLSREVSEIYKHLQLEAFGI